MVLKLSRTAVTQHNPHCIGWVRATASLWGHDARHDLDEPVRLTEEVPVRLRYKDWEGSIVADRALTLKTIRAGTHIALRFVFKSGKFFETEVSGVHAIGHGDKTVEVNAT